MSGRGKRIAYTIGTGLIRIVAYVATLFLLYWSFREQDLDVLWLLLAWIAVELIIPVDVLVHELGHLSFGWMAGMKAVSVTVYHIRFSRIGKRVRFCWTTRSDGACEMFPKSDRHLKGRVIACSLGGIAFNFIYGAVLLALYFVCPPHWALSLFAAYAPLCLADGIVALIPMELPAGKTDGGVVAALIKNEPSALVMLRVMQLQSMLYRRSYAELPRELFYDVPVVREDDPAFLSLLLMRFQYDWECGNTAQARACLDRLLSLHDDLPNDAWADLMCDAGCFYLEEGNLNGAKSCFSEAARSMNGLSGELATLALGNGDEELTKKIGKQIKRLPLQGSRMYETRRLEQIKKASANHNSNIFTPTKT